MPTSDPTSAPPTEAPPTEAPAAVAPTEAPTSAPTEEPTQTPPAAPVNTPPPLEEVRLVWAPGGVPPSDSDDVDGIVLEIKRHDGIMDGRGNEIEITVMYDPTIITLEEIQAIFRSIGHPVEVAEQ